MSTTGQLNKGGISAPLGFSGPVVFHSGDMAPSTTTTGTDTTPVVTEEYIARVFVPLNARLTGIALLNGSAVAGNAIVVLYDSSGGIVANSASTAQAGTAGYQQIPFTAPYLAKGPASYYIGVMFDSTSARFRTHILGNFGASKKTGGVYGTLTALTVPATFTTNLGPLADTY